MVAKIDPKAQSRTLIAKVTADKPFNPPWAHDLPGTENYIIVPDTPIVHDFSVKVSMPKLPQIVGVRSSSKQGCS